MAVSRSTLAALRFSTGFRPDDRGPGSAAGLLDQVQGPDPAVPKGPDIGARLKLLIAYGQARKREKDTGGSDAERKEIRQKIRLLGSQDFARALTRPLMSRQGFRERLVGFWADHFTVSAKNLRLAAAVAAFRDEAIRPNIGRSFGALLVASTTHPAMLAYLDQNTSFGPNSVIGKRRGKGLNENLAREILELHTMGVGSAYSQADVREFAELLTGLMVDRSGFTFNARMAEPGAETVLGQRYGGRRGQLSDIVDALNDIARRPETAEHIARKLAVHFVSDRPDEDLVRQMKGAFLATGGDLMATYEAMLGHEAAWQPELAKVKQPWDYVVTTLRAFGVTDQFVNALTIRERRSGLVEPMVSMGQTPFRPPGPDGWPEEAAAWITPATLTARLEWAASVARKLGEDTDPREFVGTALGDAASSKLRFAASGAEAKWEGVAVVLASPEFNRR